MKKEQTIKIHCSTSQDETVKLGHRIGQQCVGGEVFALKGELGAGKTVFAKGLGSGLDIPLESITSPTFVLLNVYRGRLRLFHYDAYRLADPGQFEDIGFSDFLSEGGVTVVEWGGRVAPLLPDHTVWVDLAHTGENSREIRITNLLDHLQ